MKSITVVGAGLSGSEAAWQLALRGHKVRLFEMRPTVSTRAHKSGMCAELVCSNSFRGAALTNAVGLLKEELRRMGSLVMQAAHFARVPAGGALAVDREVFSDYVDKKIRSHPLIEFCQEEISQIPQATADSPVVIATGPLTSPALTKQIEALVGSQNLAFFDAISPIIAGHSIDRTLVFRQSRYDKGGTDDYLNIPLNKEEYETFIAGINAAEKHVAHGSVDAPDPTLRPFEGCMPIEDMAARGHDTLRHGPLKPMGLSDPRTGHRPWAVVQLRQDDKEGTLWSMVGMQTRMKHGEQERIFRSLPGLAQAEFVRLGTVHRNTFIDSPRCLQRTLEFRTQEGLYFAGQITGVEGYVESTAGGLVAGINVARRLNQQSPIVFPSETAIGALLHYISDPLRTQFQPMNISFGLIGGYAESFDAVDRKRMGKDERREKASQVALEKVDAIALEVGAIRVLDLPPVVELASSAA